MTDYRTLCHRKIIAMGVELRAENFYIDNSISPKAAESIPDECMFYDPLAEGRIYEIFFWHRCKFER